MQLPKTIHGKTLKEYLAANVISSESKPDIKPDYKLRSKETQSKATQTHIPYETASVYESSPGEVNTPTGSPMSSLNIKPVNLSTLNQDRYTIPEPYQPIQPCESNHSFCSSDYSFENDAKRQRLWIERKSMENYTFMPSHQNLIIPQYQMPIQHIGGKGFVDYNFLNRYAMTSQSVSFRICISHQDLPKPYSIFCS